jgi:hypothetical protein
VDDGGLGVGVLLHVSPVARGQLALGGDVELAVVGVHAEPIAEEQHAVDLGAAGREDMQVDCAVRPLEEAVLEPPGSPGTCRT